MELYQALLKKPAQNMVVVNANEYCLQVLRDCAYKDHKYVPHLLWHK